MSQAALQHIYNYNQLEEANLPEAWGVCALLRAYLEHNMNKNARYHYQDGFWYISNLSIIFLLFHAIIYSVLDV